jgi:hypothetical protein
MNKEIKYLAADFASFTTQFQQFLKAYFPNSWRDFSDASTGQALIEILAYSSDILNFFISRTANELLLDNAVQKESVYAIARSLGYRPQKKACSLVDQTVYVQVPAEYLTGVPLPDYRYAFIFKRGSSILAQNGTIFETLYNIDFSQATGSDSYIPSQVNSATSQVEWFSLKRNTLALSAQTKLKSFSITDFSRFRKLTIDDTDSIDIFDVIDNQSNRWYEVDYLTQNTIFEASVNTNYDNTLVPYVMKLKKVPRRFVTEFDYSTGYISLTFGSGKEDLDDSVLIPNISEVSIPLYGKEYFSDFSIDPQNFLNTKTLGLSPYNTILNVYYRSGGGASSVVKANDISKIDKATYEWKYTGLNSTIQNQVVNSLSTTNLEPSIGGRDEDTIFEIKQKTKSFFAAQSRCVTREDYQIRLLSMPTIFGSFCKVNVKKSCRSTNAIEIVVLCYDENGNYSDPSDTLVKNAKTYLQKYALLTDNVFIRPANVVNFTINYVIICNENANRNTVLALCTNSLVAYFDKNQMQINQPIIRSDIVKVLQSITGVYSVSSLDFTFTDTSVKEENGIFKVPNEDSIFEIDNFATDIAGIVR